jgi:hypothetical protein
MARSSLLGTATGSRAITGDASTARHRHSGRIHASGGSIMGGHPSACLLGRLTADE